MNKLILLFSALAASTRSVAIAGILGQYHSQNEIHEYSFGYYGGPSAKHESKIHNVTKGEYSYVDPNGKLQTVNYTSDEHGFRVNATNLPTKLGHAIAPVNGTPRSHTGYPYYPSYYPAPPPVVLQPPVVYYPQPAPIVPHPIDHTYFVPEVIASHNRVRRDVYPSGPSPKSYAPEGYYQHPESYAAPTAYVPSVKSFIPSEPAEYVAKPSSPAFTYARAHIPVQEVTHDIPEETPAPAVPGKQLFVPAVVRQLVPQTTTTPAPTTAAPVTTPAPAYQPYYPENPPHYSPPSPSTPPPPPSPTPYATTPAPTPSPEIYIKPVVRHYAPIPANQYYEAPRYEHEAPVHAPPPAPTTTLPPPTTTAAPLPAPTTRAPNPHRDEYYFVPHEPRPAPVVAPLPVVPIPVVPVAPVIATPVRSQFHSQDELGQYTYGYSNENSAKHEIKTADGITQGQYSYVDANGHVQSVHYVSDDHHGFRVAATNLPRAPVPVPVPVVPVHKK
uniref:Cuticle protein 6 n=1 Tax=Cacopsylla melanoneura TaxID=428564 RepID=A0A8D8U9U5_9HEMI